MSDRTLKEQQALRSPAPAGVIRPPETTSPRGRHSNTLELYEIVNYSRTGPMTKPKRH